MSLKLRDIISAVNKKSGHSHEDIRKIIYEFYDAIAEALHEHEVVSLYHIGTFSPRITKVQFGKNRGDRRVVIDFWFHEKLLQKIIEGTEYDFMYYESNATGLGIPTKYITEADQARHKRRSDKTKS